MVFRLPYMGHCDDVVISGAHASLVCKFFILAE